MARRLITKAVVSAYTRKDGTLVRQHDSGRQAAAPKKIGTKRRKAIPVSNGSAISDHADEFVKYAADYEAKYGESDDSAKFFCAGQNMKAGDFEGLKRTLSTADSFHTEHILPYIHPELWESLGCVANDMNRSMKLHERKFPKVEIKTGNEGYGFHGGAVDYAVRSRHGVDTSLFDLKREEREQAETAAAHSFSRAARYLVDNGYFSGNEEARDFLDSRQGRHLHDAAFEHGGDINKTKYLKSCVDAYLKETGQSVKTPTIKEHSNYDQGDYTHLKAQGLDDKAIKAVWDRDAKLGHGAQSHASKVLIRRTKR